MFGWYAFQNLGVKIGLTRITCLACMRFKTWVTQITGLVGMVQKLKIRVVLPHGTNLRVFVLTYVILAPGACGRGVPSRSG